jgi:diguanylate cyclase
MAADVGEHNTEVGNVDRELERVAGGSAAKVDELVQRLVAAYRSVQSKLTQTEGKLDELSNKMEYHASEARTDVLTGLANRRAFQEEAARAEQRFRESGQAFSLIMIDIDRFKQVNDVHGHPFGDDVLRGVGEILLQQFRGRDLVSRYGGEEFAILMPATPVAEARRIAETVREVVENAPFDYSGESLNLTISLGVAEIGPQDNMPELLKRADQAMYTAKNSGRNQVYWHDGTLPQPMRAANAQRVRSVNLSGVPTGEESSVAPQVRPALATAEADSVNQTPEEQQTEAAHDADEPAPENVLPANKVDMDLLNNMGNKTMFCQNVHRRIAEFHRGGTVFSTILLSIDQDKQIIRTHGEQAWKVTMGVVAQAIRNRLREMDLVARYNDATFGMVLPEASLRNGICIGERLRKTVEETAVEFEGTVFSFTVSLGVVEVEDGDEMATLVERARGQLEQAQSGGGNRTGFSASALIAS